MAFRVASARQRAINDKALELIKSRAEVANSTLESVKKIGEILKPRAMREVTSLVASFRDLESADKVAMVIERQAEDISGRKEAGLVSDLAKTLALYRKPAKWGVLDGWDEVAEPGHTFDYGTKQGALALGRVMRSRKIAAVVNSMNHPGQEWVSTAVAELAIIAACMRDEECTLKAVVAAKKEPDSNSVVAAASQLSGLAHHLATTRANNYIQVKPEGRAEFLKAVRKIQRGGSLLA